MKIRLYMNDDYEILVDTITDEVVFRKRGIQTGRFEVRITVKSINDASRLGSRPPCPRKPYMPTRDLTKGPGLMKLEPSNRSRKPS